MTAHTFLDPRCPRCANLRAASAMSTGTAKTPKAVEGRSPASATAEGGDAQPKARS